ncbi:bifunctional diguanylate cyclase/phosphodiesterase [Aliiglaciecola sp. CAU 1673]|uniref:putative bifunctional diguanylate cyclase/phosphodiesterase n=1 Tax=Aliiglaciecola sp. CAU 1673 TaxID=3032595 RepID=UPI0023DCB41F|nr:bifunctional diguanylate cyclase/phosphodiesterase [Aliiglaciecola sp. CAU 1673]MDF2176664.1 bifunctional diguanylate cyclase/phosphodiesterase [Aliiglaciecola sp. CAU 1673]
MSLAKKRMLHRALTLYILVIGVGLVLAGMVYSTAISVKDATNVLIEKRLPNLIGLGEVAMRVSEQERVLYEYYATTDPAHYLDTHQGLFDDLIVNVERLLIAIGLSADNHPLLLELQKIKKLAEQLHTNLSSSRIDWDLAREKLEDISASRRNMQPQLQALKQLVKARAEASYVDTMQQLDQTVWTVTGFATALLLFTVLLGRYTRRYVGLSAENERLAIFTKRNPNPILSLSAQGQVVYHNPASERLMKNLGFTDTNPQALLADDLLVQLALTKKADSKVGKFEHQIGDTYLSYEVHWVKELDAYDIHIQDVTEQVIANQKLEHKAYHKDLSGLPNRAKMNKDLGKRIDSGNIFSLVLLDVTHYSQLVGNFGLNGASQCMRAFAEELAIAFEQAKETLDLGMETQLYHIGDANFTIITDLDNESLALRQLSDRLNYRFAHPIDTPLGQMRIGITQGVTEYPRCSQLPEELLLHAKIAIDEGRKQEYVTRFFDHDSGSRHARRLSVTRQLERAMENEKLTLHFQPKLDLETQQVDGCESLIRWFQEDGSAISPGEFIPLAEKSGLILPLGDWILEMACRKALSWQAQGLEQSIAVNISARQFAQPDFAKKVQDLLHKIGLPARLLELEITESMIMDNRTFGTKVLNELRDIGVTLSIDDFGTGYSSLAYLKGFPVDKLKIDQSFVRNMHQDKSDQAIVLSLCQLSRNLGLKTVAEGVERADQLKLLRHYQCDAIQGYWFSKPLPEEKFLELLSRPVTMNLHLNNH